MGQKGFSQITITDLTDNAIINSKIYYQAAGASAPAVDANLKVSGNPGSNWKTTYSETTLDASKPKLWQIVVFEYENYYENNYKYQASNPVVVGMYTENGAGITSVTTSYYYAVSDNGGQPPALNDSSWIESNESGSNIPETSPTQPYLWARITTILTFDKDLTDNYDDESHKNQKTTHTYTVSSTMDSISVGGRNLILNSENIDNTLNLDDINDKPYAFINEINANENVSETFYVVDDIEYGSIYTLHFFAKALYNTTLKLYYCIQDNIVEYDDEQDTDGEQYVNKTLIEEKNITNQWQHFIITFNTNVEFTSILFEYNNNNNNSNTCFLYHPKLELGNIATDWTAALNDIQNNIEQSEKYASQIYSIIEYCITDNLEENNPNTILRLYEDAVIENNKKPDDEKEDIVLNLNILQQMPGYSDIGNNDIVWQRTATYNSSDDSTPLSYTQWVQLELINQIYAFVDTVSTDTYTKIDGGNITTNHISAIGPGATEYNLSHVSNDDNDTDWWIYIANDGIRLYNELELVGSFVGETMVNETMVSNEANLNTSKIYVEKNIFKNKTNVSKNIVTLGVMALPNGHVSFKEVK